MSQSKGSPRKFAEKIALLNKKQAESNAEFEKILKEVEETTRAPFPSRTSSFSSWNGERPDSNSQQVSLDTFNYHQNQSVSVTQAQQQHDTPQIHVQHLNHNHHQHQQLQQQLHLQQSSPDPMSIQTPDGVPNIEIFPIQYDDDYNQQQVTTNNNYQLRNVCSSSISSARSLPDIANLRVSSSFAQMAPSYSDRRIPSDYNYSNFDTNSNIVTDLDNTQACYFQNHNNNNSNDSTSHNPQETNDQTWNVPDVHNQYPSNSLPQHQAVHQSYYQQQSQQHQIPVVRGGQTKSTVLGSWTNTVSLNTPKTVLNGTLSKSSEGCYNYLGNYQDDIPNLFSNDASTYNTGQTMGNPIMRSSSFNNIENINTQQVDTKILNYPQQNLQQEQQQQQQQRLPFEPSQSQFYE